MSSRRRAGSGSRVARGPRELRKLRERFASQRGSALVLVMFIVLLLTILGVGVLSATLSGAQRTETRENDVQSLHLAQKKIDEVIAYITADLNRRLESGSDIPQEELDGQIHTFLAGLQNKTAEFASNTSLQGGANEITGITLDDSASTGSQYVVVIRANANVNGVSRTLEQRVEITTFPDFLNYSLGSEGNVILNGAPYTHGNVYAGNQLKLSPIAQYKHAGADLTESSLYPLIDGEAHVQSLDAVRYWNGADYSTVPINDEDQYNRVDERVKKTYENSLVKKKNTFVQIDVEDSFLDKVAEASGSSGNKAALASTYYGAEGPKSGESALSRGGRLAQSFIREDGSGAIGSQTVPVLRMPERSDFNGYADDSLTEDELAVKREQLYNEAVQAFKSQLAHLNSSAIYNGDLNLDGVTLNEITDTAKAGGSQTEATSHWLIVNGNLNIDNYSSAAPITVQANLLVVGNLNIKGDVRFDSTLYTLGSTNIVNASITGKDNKELVVISKGAVLVNRVDEFKDQDKVTELRAFFYTDSTAELYGVGSVFSIDGGFFAKGDLTINAVVGKVSAVPGQYAFSFENQDQTEPAASRFQVRYNEQVFEDQKVGLPRVKMISIHAGPVELKP
ncbi:hypothetical protein D3C81_359920 [compost metagenome]